MSKIIFNDKAQFDFVLMMLALSDDCDCELDISERSIDKCISCLEKKGIEYDIKIKG